MTIIFKGTRPDHNIVYVQIYIYTGADTGFSSGGGQIGREAPEKFFVPPLSSSGGGQGGDSPPPEIALSKDFAPFIK